MKIHYDVAIDDLVAYSRHQCGRSMDQRRSGGIQWTILTSLGLVLVTAALVGKQAALAMLMLVAIPVAFILLLLFVLAFRPNDQRSLRKFFEHSLPRGEIGPHELELTDDWLVERTPYSERRTPLQDIQGLKSDGDRTFLIIGPTMAHVIPHRSMLATDLDAFIEAIRIRLSQLPGDKPPATSRLRARN